MRQREARQRLVDALGGPVLTLPAARAIDDEVDGIPTKS